MIDMYRMHIKPFVPAKIGKQAQESERISAAREANEHSRGPQIAERQP